MDKAAGAALSNQYLLIYDHDMKNEVQKSARAVELLQARVDQTRVDILDELSEGECWVCELTEPFTAAQSRFSFHFKTLKDADRDCFEGGSQWMHKPFGISSKTSTKRSQ